MALGKTVFFKKLVDGGVSIYLQDIEGSLPARWFSMDHKVSRIGVPLNYALSIFVDSSVESMMRKNLFEIENLDSLIKEAEELGYIAPSEEEVKELTAPKRTKEMLLAILKGGNEKKLRELFESSDKERAVEIITASYKDFSMDTIQKIEDILGMAISEE